MIFTGFIILLSFLVGAMVEKYLSSREIARKKRQINSDIARVERLLKLNKKIIGRDFK